MNVKQNKKSYCYQEVDTTIKVWYNTNMTGFSSKRAMAKNRWYYQQFTEMDEFHMDIFYERAYWKKVFLWRPRQCSLTGKTLWLRWAYMGTTMWTGPGDPVFEYRFHEKKQHLIWALGK
jgi:hypothetical protein